MFMSRPIELQLSCRHRQPGGPASQKSAWHLQSYQTSQHLKPGLARQAHLDTMKRELWLISDFVSSATPQGEWTEYLHVMHMYEVA